MYMLYIDYYYYTYISIIMILILSTEQRSNASLDTLIVMVVLRHFLLKSPKSGFR